MMDALVEYFLNNHDKLFFAIAGASLVIELTIMGLSGVLLFFSIACAITGILISTGIITHWEFEILSVGLLSVLSALILWKPLKRFQGSKTTVSDSSSDMIGQIVPVADEVTENGGTIRHSGINWQARLDNNSTVKPLESGKRVEISAVDGNVMIVKAL
jgi:membrane protein implicated in regulation of membrane protease activity